MTYAGDLTPLQAWKVLADKADAILVDVRTEAEWAWVGVPLTTGLPSEPYFVQWTTPAGRNPDFVSQVVAAAGLTPGDERPVVLLCRSGNRSIGAAEALTAAGFGPAYNVLDGFEGQLDENGHRGGAGWRAVGLPWRQK